MAAVAKMPPRRIVHLCQREMSAGEHSRAYRQVIGLGSLPVGIPVGTLPIMLVGSYRYRYTREQGSIADGCAKIEAYQVRVGFRPCLERE